MPKNNGYGYNRLAENTTDLKERTELYNLAIAELEKLGTDKAKFDIARIKNTMASDANKEGKALKQPASVQKSREEAGALTISQQIKRKKQIAILNANLAKRQKTKVVDELKGTKQATVPNPSLGKTVRSTLIDILKGKPDEEKSTTVPTLVP